MRFFEAIPSELFSPLASPNRALYADALDVLYSAYRDNLKIREDALYSMLRSKLEEQLADATFEGEDIDEEELRDISGRARFRARRSSSRSCQITKWSVGAAATMRAVSAARISMLSRFSRAASISPIAASWPSFS